MDMPAHGGRCRVVPVCELLSYGASAALLLCLVLPAEVRLDAEQQNDSRPRMSCLAIGIGTVADTLLEQFSRRKHEYVEKTTTVGVIVNARVLSPARDEYRAIVQQRRRMSVPCRDERAR